MDWLKTLAQPHVIGPMIGLVAVVGWAINKALKSYFDHMERMERIRMGMEVEDYEEES